MFQWRQLRVRFRTLPNSSPLVLPNGLFHGCTIANANVYVLPKSHNDSAWIFCSNWTIQVAFSRINGRLNGRFARFRILVVVFARCNSQSETLSFGNKPIRLWQSYRRRLLFLCVTILITPWKQHLLWRTFGVDIVLKTNRMWFSVVCPLILVLPYLGFHSAAITRRLKSFVYKFYSFFNLRVVFQNTCRIKSFFPYKDRFNRSQKSKIV